MTARITRRETIVPSAPGADRARRAVGRARFSAAPASASATATSSRSRPRAAERLRGGAVAPGP
jgi:hypothetical protein